METFYDFSSAEKKCARPLQPHIDAGRRVRVALAQFACYAAASSSSCSTSVRSVLIFQYNQHSFVVSWDKCVCESICIYMCVCLREFCTQVIHIDALSLLFLGFGVFACYFRVLVFARFAVLLYFLQQCCVFLCWCVQSSIIISLQMPPRAPHHGPFSHSESFLFILCLFERVSCLPLSLSHFVCLLLCMF